MGVVWGAIGGAENGSGDRSVGIIGRDGGSSGGSGGGRSGGGV